MTNKHFHDLVCAELKKQPIEIGAIHYDNDFCLNPIKYLQMEDRLPVNVELTYTDISELEDYVEIKRGSLGKNVSVIIVDGKAEMSFKNKAKFLENTEDAENHLRHMQNHIDYEIDRAFRAALGKFINEGPLPDMTIAKSEVRALKGFSDFSKCDDATTLVRLANSGGRIGAREKIGYWVIDIVNGTVIPVARSDEHHRGLDFVHHLVEKGKLPDSIYIPIWAGNQIIWDGETLDANLLILRAYRIWLANGGEDYFVEINRPKCIVSMSDFVKCEGVVKGQDSESTALTKQGRAIVRDLVFIADALSRHRSNRDFKENSLWDHCDELVWLAKNHPSLMYDVKVDTSKYQKIKEESDYSELEQFIFAFNGIKNQIHIAVKEQVNDKKGFKIKDFSLAFGNLEEFERKLSSISEAA